MGISRENKFNRILTDCYMITISEYGLHYRAICLHLYTGMIAINVLMDLFGQETLV